MKKFRCLTLTVWYFLSQLCTYTPGTKIQILIYKISYNIKFDFVGLVFYKCGDIYSGEKNTQNYDVRIWNETVIGSDINRNTGLLLFHNQTYDSELLSSNNISVVDRYM